MSVFLFFILDGVQVGGYDGYKLFTNAVPVSFPSAWNVCINNFNLLQSLTLCYLLR